MNNYDQDQLRNGRVLASFGDWHDAPPGAPLDYRLLPDDGWRWCHVEPAPATRTPREPIAPARQPAPQAPHAPASPSVSASPLKIATLSAYAGAIAAIAVAMQTPKPVKMTAQWESLFATRPLSPHHSTAASVGVYLGDYRASFATTVDTLSTGRKGR